MRRAGYTAIRIILSVEDGVTAETKFVSCRSHNKAYRQAKWAKVTQAHILPVTNDITPSLYADKSEYDYDAFVREWREIWGAAVRF